MVRPFLVASLASAVALSLSGTAFAATVPGATTVLLPAGTSIPVHVVGQVNSGSAKAGDTFPIAVAQDVVLDGMILVRKGAGGQGEIAAADSAGGNGHSGSLGLKFDYVYSADGGKVRLSDSMQTQSEEDRKGASSTATIIGFATFGIGGLFGHNLAHGRNKTVDEKTIVNAYVADTVHVDATEKGEVEHYDK